MSEKARHPAIAIKEWVDPSETMMRSGGGNDAGERRQSAGAIDFLETSKELRESNPMRSDVPADFHNGLTKSSGLHLFFAAILRPDVLELVGKPMVEFPVNPTEELGCANIRWSRCGETFLDQKLDFDVGFVFELKCAQGRIDGEVLSKCSLDVGRVRVVPLDQVGVVAVHRAD